MKNQLLIIFLFLSSGSLFGQPGGGPPPGERPEPNGEISGHILDAETGDPLPYTNVVLYRRGDSTMVTGAIAGEDGHFLLDELPFGNFYLELKFIGYSKKILPGIMIMPDRQQVELGNISLAEATEHLEEVQVTAERSPIEYKIDRKVIRVEENLTSQGESAARALENAPSVTVDIDGNVMLRGSSNFTVLIDGKPSPLEGSDALRQIPASAVAHIEVITNPSAKYDPDGLAGIINIVTKKRALDGINGILNASAGTNDKYRADGLFNYKMDRISVYVGADFNDENRLGSLSRTQITQSGDSARYVISDGDGGHGHDGYTLKGGFTYAINSGNSISLEGSIGQHGMKRTINDRFEEYTLPGSETMYYISRSRNRRTHDFYNLTLNYSRLFDQNGHELTSYLNFQGEQGRSKETQDRYFTDPYWTVIDDDPYRIYTTEESEGWELRYQLDYTRPVFSTGKLETGYQLRRDREDESYDFNVWSSDAGDWIDNPDFSSSMKFSRIIQAAYGILGKEWDLLSIQAGLRAEYTYRRVDHRMSDDPAIIDRLDLFPSVHTSRKIGKNDQMLASYSRRINRPRGFYLDPFPEYMDPNNLRMGNPELEPEYINSFEVSYQKGIGKSSFISLEGYHRATHNSITRVMTLQDDGTRLHTMENLNREYSSGAELMVNLLVTKWFNLNTSANYYHYLLEGDISNEDVAATSNNFDARLNANFRITPTTRLQVQGFYQGPSVTAQGRRQDFLMTSAAIRQDLFKEKLSATLQIQDIFGTGSFAFVSEGQQFYDEFNFRRESQVVRLALSFRINNYKKNNGRNGDGQGEGGDMLMSY